MYIYICVCVCVCVCDLSLQLNVFYVIFVVYDIFPSRVPSSDVILLKIAERTKVANKRHKDQRSDFSSKCN